MRVVPDIIEEFIGQMNFTCKVLSVATNIVFVADVFHARAGTIILLDNVPYTVASVDYSSNSLTLTANVSGSPTLYTVPTPFFFHGTPYATNTQLSRVKPDEKVPMIYLLEILRETIQAETSRFDTVADLRLFFLDAANFKDWSTDDHYSYAILPMRSLALQFIQQSRQYKLFGQLGDCDLITHVKFGEYQDLKGHINSIFNERLSGIEIRCQLPIKFSCTC